VVETPVQVVEKYTNKQKHFKKSETMYSQRTYLLLFEARWYPSRPPVKITLSIRLSVHKKQHIHWT